jgi:hypothetical protein
VGLGAAGLALRLLRPVRVLLSAGIILLAAVAGEVVFSVYIAHSKFLLRIGFLGNCETRFAIGYSRLSQRL